MLKLTLRDDSLPPLPLKSEWHSLLTGGPNRLRNQFSRLDDFERDEGQD
jgi:hypothetical protein